MNTIQIADLRQWFEKGQKPIITQLTKGYHLKPINTDVDKLHRFLLQQILKGELLCKSIVRRGGALILE